MLVRKIQVTDIDSLMIMMEYYRDEAGIADEDWDTDSLLRTFKQFVISKDYVVLVALEAGRVVGCLVGAIKKEFYNDKVDCVIQFLFLHSSLRIHSNYNYLYKEFEKLCETIKARRILLIDPHDTQERIQPIADTLGFLGRTLRVFSKEIE